MVVLKTIIGFKGTSWQVQDIAQGFLEYYLNHPEHLIDYDELARQDNPGDYSLEKLVSHILRMPLYYLSNKSTDWFVLDKEQNTFSLKPELSNFWQDGSYRKLVLDRADYALKRYFYRKTRQTNLNLTQNSL